MLNKLLFIEDEEEFAEIVTSYLKGSEFEVKCAFSGKESLEELQNNLYDLIILDLGLPDIDGLKLCAIIRKRWSIPILILSAKDGIQDKVVGFDVGADDYLVKPASLKELVMRINRLLDRNLQDKFRSSVFQFNDFEFNTITGQLKSKGKSVMLTKKEKAILEYLLIKKGQVLTRLEIMDHVWGEGIDLFSNTVNTIVSSLRKKIRQLSKKDFIKSVHGLGYKLELEE